MSKFKLIITADDYGIHPVVDDAIIDGIKRGVINSVTVLMNLDTSEKALKRLAKFLKDNKLTKKVGVGIHLNVTTGSPLVKTNNSTLVKSNNDFFNVTHYLDKNSVDSDNEIQISKELIAQVDYFLTILEDLKIDIPLDHFTSQHNVLISKDKYAKIVGILSYYFAAHGRFPPKPIPIRRPMPIGKEFAGNKVLSKKVTSLRKETWKYLRESNLDINTGIFALINFSKNKFRKIIEIFSNGGIQCPDLMLLSFFASSQGSTQKIVQFQNMLDELYDASVKEGTINKGDSLYIEIVHHLGRIATDKELKEVEKINGFNIDYFTNCRPIEYELIKSTEYQDLLKLPNVSHGIFSGMNG